jgi:hypothetical protein
MIMKLKKAEARAQRCCTASDKETAGWIKILKIILL